MPRRKRTPGRAVVADSLISISPWPSAFSSFSMTRRMRSSSSQGWPSRKLSLRSAATSRPLRQHLAEVGALSEIRDVRIALDPLPTHRSELLAERALDQIVFPLGSAHLRQWSAKCGSSVGPLSVRSSVGGLPLIQHRDPFAARLQPLRACGCPGGPKPPVVCRPPQR